MKQNRFRTFIAGLLLIFGLVFIISPAIISWFINGKQAWIINGPYSYSNFGGGSFQLLIYAVLVVVGISLIVISSRLKKQ